MCKKLGVSKRKCIFFAQLIELQLVYIVQETFINSIQPFNGSNIITFLNPQWPWLNNVRLIKRLHSSISRNFIFSYLLQEMYYIFHFSCMFT
ncbi:hypothetical protein Selin_0232 [Desulfurispirillum indicum S5]|uniref:Uncharacterized protein n=1 Tax=Desulfurispirillum indicum (strain ATCC BAA-1389 / DSM 22839 / S5) TaxID=653733 RepID=E6W650_DESIS|nr:hypothetical protein Selin_0232 [Desulfurispirillum indicum S5]